jgi:hypothetical protein
VGSKTVYVAGRRGSTSQIVERTVISERMRARWGWRSCAHERAMASASVGNNGETTRQRDEAAQEDPL